MNILVLGWRDPKHPTSGGAEQVMHEHMKGWVRQGHLVTLFSSHFKNAKRKENLDGIEIIRHGYQLLGVHAVAFFWYFFGNHKKFDLVVDQFHGIPFFTPLYVRSKKLAVIQEVAREVWFDNHLPKPLSYIVGFVGFNIEPVVFKIYKKIIFMTGSESAKNDLIKMGIKKDKIKIIHHGIIIKAPKKFVKKEKIKTLTFLGAITKDKGIEEIVSSFSLLVNKKKFPKLNLWIIGKGNVLYIKHIKNLVNSKKIGNRTVFWGFVSLEKKFELLKKSHLLINPSIREWWGLVNIEANAMGTPVVAYNSPGLTDSVKDNVSGILCKKNSPEEMAQVVEELLKNSKKYKKLQKKSIKWSKKFTWKGSQKLSIDLIEKIFNNK